MKVRITFTEALLGTSPNNPDIYADFVGIKNPKIAEMEDDEELEALEGASSDKGVTVFPRTEDGQPFLYDYQVKGFFKDTCGGLRKVSTKLSSKIKSYKKEIDKLVFVFPRKIVLNLPGEITLCQRPLRAMTMRGERVSLACSEMAPIGTTCEFEIECLDPSMEKAVREWLDYGRLSGIGQWRNSGAGRFTWEEIE